jgi:hypothetical protein
VQPGVFSPERRSDVGIIEGPDIVSNATLDAIVAELGARNPGLWIDAGSMYLIYFHVVAVELTIPDVDPFEPSRLQRIFAIAEDVVVKHIPHDIPIRDDTESWTVRIVAEGSRAAIDVIMGGRRKASRNERLSVGIGPGARETAASSSETGSEAGNPLWDYLLDKRALEELVAEGASMHVTATIVGAAVDTGDVDLVRLLLKAGGLKLLHAFDDDLAWTPLMAAAKNGDVAMVRYLLDAGSDVNAHDEAKIGDTALMLAVRYGHYDTAVVLIEHGADPTIPGWMGRTPLDDARDRKRMPELYALLKSAVRPRAGEL